MTSGGGGSDTGGDVGSGGSTTWVRRVGGGEIVFSTVGAGGGGATVGGGGGGALVADTVTLTSVGVMIVSFWFNQMKAKATVAINAATNNATGSRNPWPSRAPSGRSSAMGLAAEVS